MILAEACEQENLAKESIFSREQSPAHCNQPATKQLADSSKEMAHYQGLAVGLYYWHTGHSAVAIARSALVSGSTCC